MNAVVKRKGKNERRELKEKLKERRTDGSKNAKYMKISEIRIAVKVKININCMNVSEESL